MVKMGAHTFEHPNRIKFRNKSTADAFETIIAAIYKERGVDVLRAWLKKTYWPLLQVARAAYIL
jgi:dsRNA-specific ribonuclease